MDGPLDFLLVALLAFICELISSVLGGGYGSILTPALILLGYELEVAVPCVLTSQLISNAFLVYMHHRLGTIRLSLNSDDVKVAGVLAACGVVGVVLAVLALVRLPDWIVDAYVGLIILLVGLLVLARKGVRVNSSGKMSLRKLALVGVLSAFNKGLSGGGYGPLLSGGQVISGMGAKKAIGRMLLAEVAICFTGILAYLVAGLGLHWPLIAAATLGSTLMAVPSAYLVKRAREDKLRMGMGLLISALGLAMLLKLFITT